MELCSFLSRAQVGLSKNTLVEEPISSCVELHLTERYKDHSDAHNETRSDALLERLLFEEKRSEHYSAWDLHLLRAACVCSQGIVVGEVHQRNTYAPRKPGPHRHHECIMVKASVRYSEP